MALSFPSCIEVLDQQNVSAMSVLKKRSSMNSNAVKHQHQQTVETMSKARLDLGFSLPSFVFLLNLKRAAVTAFVL